MTGILLSLLGGKVPAVPDPYFEYTTLLLPGNGTNGAQNNTFLDGSTNNFTITRNGNTTQGTFSPFSQTGWGNYFDGSGDSLTVPSGSSVSGTGNFTVEFFIYPSTIASGYKVVYINDTSGGFAVLLNSTGTLSYGRALVAVDGTTTGTVTFNQWNHVAFVRSGTGANQFVCYINGSSAGSFTNSTSYASGIVRIGTDAGGVNFPFDGYLSNVRSATVAVYTGAFTVPTSPLTATQSAGTNISAITGTQTSLLTCQSNRFIDNSTNNFTITVNGNTSVQAFSPFNPTSSWSAVTNGGSGYFDGNGDYLTVASSGAQPQGTEDFCIEMWVYLTTISTTTDTPWIEVSTNNAVQIYTTTSGTVLVFGIYGVGNVTTYTLPSGITNAWNHFVFTRSSNAWRLMHNGVLRANSTSSASLSTGTMSIFSRGASNYSTGYCGLTRIVRASIPTEYQTSSTTNGTSIYTVPTAPATTTSQGAASGDVKLLLNFTNAGIYDATSKNDLETVGNAQISTTQSKWGGSSMSFDGTGDWLLIPDQPIQRIRTGNFTVEGWVYRNSSGTYGLIGKGTGTTGWLVSLNSSNQVVFTYGSSTITSTGTVSATTWTHIAVVREGTSTNQTKIYINGTNDGTGTVSTDFNQTNSMYVGADRTGGSAANAYMQDVRVTNYARYTANFTAPTAAFPTL